MGEMWRLYQKKKIHETSKKASLDSTRGFAGHYTQKSIELFYFRDLVAKKEPLKTNSRNTQ